MWIELKNLSVSYGRVETLQGVSAAVPAGRFVLCTGPSGGGKSTLARTISGALPRHANLHGAVHAEAPVAAIWQEPSASLSPFRRIGRQIEDVLVQRGAPRQEAETLLGQVGLAGRSRAYPHELSAGQIQRTAIARALAMDPRVLVADEPTSSLDAATEREIVALLGELRRPHLRPHLTVLWITHRPQAALALATDYWNVQNGRLTVGDTPEPAHAKVPSPVAAKSGPAQQPFEPLEASGLRKSYAAAVLEDVCLTLGAGQTITLRGASGSGKSTLGRILAGIEKADAGQVRRPGPVAYVWPDPATAINGRWRVDDVIAEALQIRGVAPGERRRAALQWMDRVQLPAHYGARRAGELSGGERRRVSIARALIGEPRYVVFDEATSGLHGKLRDEIVGLLAQLQRESQAGYLWITHEVESVWPGPSYVLENGELRPDA